MLREKCRTCGSGDLYQGRMGAQGGVSVVSAKSFFKATNIAKCAVCVTCGGIEPYLDEAGMAKVRGWKATESHNIPTTPGEGDDTRMQVNLRILLLVIGVCAAAAAFAIQMMNAAGKMK